MSLMPDGMFITEQEFLFLAISEGIQEFYGLPVGKAAGERSDQQLYESIFEMLHSGVMIMTEKGIEADAWLKKSFQIIRNSQQILIAAEREKQMPVTCYYLGDQIVCIRESLRKPGYLYLGRMEKEQIAEDICTQYQLLLGQMEAEEYEALEEQKKENQKFLTAAQVLKNEQNRFLLERVHTATGEITMRLIISDGVLYPQLSMETCFEQKNSYCSKRRFAAWISEMM